MIGLLRADVAACLLLLLPGCGGTTVAENGCSVELAAVPPAESAAVDVELLVPGIVDKLGAEPYWSDVQSIGTACAAPAVFPDQYRLPGHGDSHDDVKAIGLLRMGRVSGVVFAYRSRGAEETLTGVAAALVEYRPDGTPERIYKASELLGGEGWSRVTKSTISTDSIERCTQEVEYATYSESGDIIGELEDPVRSPPFCERIIQFPR